MLRLRAELDVYANLRPARDGEIDLVIVRELVGGLYFGARGVRDDGTVFDTCEYHPSQVERLARRGFELARDARRKADVGRQGERARDVAALAPRRPRGRRRLPGRRGRGHARRQRGDAARERSRAVRRRRHREHVRGHPLRPRRGDDRRARARAVGEPRRRRPGDLRAGPRLGARHRRTRHRESRRECSARRRSCSSTASAGRTRPRRSTPAVESALVATPTPDLGGRATTAEFSDAVVAALERA